jgi:hypothetical protein
MTILMLIILLSVTVCAGGGWLYFQCIQMPRPSIGVFGLSDVLIVFVFILLIPLLYVLLPGWIMTGLLLLSGLSLLYAALEPLKHLGIVWGLTCGLIGADLLSGFTLGTQHPLHQAINNAFVALCVISISNTWAQTGMKARDAAILASLLILYDFIATTQHSLMNDLFAQAQTLPLAPLISWSQREHYAAIGLGDVLMVTVFPLTMRKGFGTRAGVIALGVGLTAVIWLSVLPIKGIFPVMALLGPLIVAQYLFWRRSPEHPMKQMYRERANTQSRVSSLLPDGHF